MKNRNENVKKGKLAEGKIIEHLTKFEGCRKIKVIGDYTTKRLKGETLTEMEKIENDINMLKGIDMQVNYIDEGVGWMVEYGYNIDAKGFKYDSRYYGEMDDEGKVEKLMLQVEKKVVNIKTATKGIESNIYKGWANNPKHLTHFITINISGWVYYLKYVALVEYLKDKSRYNTPYNEFKKANGGYEICLIVPVKGLLESGVITAIVPL